MASISALDAKTRFGQLLTRVARGEEVVITRHERPVARLTRAGGGNPASVRRAIADLRQLRAKIGIRSAGKPKLSLAQVKSAVREGRA